MLPNGNVLVEGGSVPTFASAEIYNFAWDSSADYSATENPSGAWSYGRKFAGSGSAMDLFTVQWGTSGWYLGNFGNGGPSVQAGPLLWAKANNNGYPCVRWTCPAAGRYNISGTFTGADSRGVDALVNVAVGGGTFSERLQANLQTAPFANNNVFLNNGDVVDFTIAWGGGVSSDYSWTDLDAQISGVVPPLVSPVQFKDADLSTLTFSGVPLSPAFSSSVTNYTATVSNSVTSVTVIPALSNSSATVQVVGGSNLVVGTNPVTITVTAMDGTTVKTYTVVVFRESAPLPGVTTASVVNTVIPAPQTLSAKFDSFDDYALNRSGSTALLATLTGSGVTPSNNQGIWTIGAGGGALLARTNDLAPGAGGSVFSSLGSPEFDDRNHVAFVGALRVARGQQNGVWTNVTGRLQLLARTGGPAPGSPGAKFATLSRVMLPNAGKAMFIATLQSGGGVDASNNMGLWVGNTPGALRQLIRKGSSIRVGDTMRTVTNVSLFAAAARKSAPASGSTPSEEPKVMDNTGTTVLRVTCNDSTAGIVTASQNEVFTPVAWTNTPAPAPGNQTLIFSAFENPVIDNRGKTAFLATVSGPGVSSKNNNNTGIWSNGGGRLALVARTGDKADGGGVFKQFANPVTNSRGEVAFKATLRTGVVGVWWLHGGKLKRVASSQTIGPAAEGSGALYKNFTGLVLPDRGGPLFSAQLDSKSPGVTASNAAGIWAVDTIGRLDLMVRQGQWMQSGGNAKSISAPPEFIAKPGSYNDVGGFIYKAKFNDGSQAINRAVCQ